MAPSDPTSTSPPTSTAPAEALVSVGSGMYKIDTLTGQDNYIVWRMRMVDILVDCSLYDYVDGTKADPGSTNPSESTKWSSNDCKALSAIRLRCSDAISVQLVRFTSSKDCWEHLNSLYKSSSLLGLLSARNCFYCMVMRDDQSLEDHMRELCIAMDKLTILRETLNELDYALQVVGSLSVAWQTFIGTISWRVDRSKTTERNAYAADLLAHLMDEERRHQGAMNGSDVTLFSKSAPNRLNKSNVKCHHCKKKGHIKVDCWAEGGGAYKPGSGHWKHGGRGKGKSDDANAAIEMACMAYNEFVPQGAWLLDSATSSHVVTDRANFSTYTPTPNAVVTGIGGGAKIAGQGEVVVELTGSKGKRTALRLKDVAHVPSAPHNLVSAGRVTGAGMKLIGEGDIFDIRSSLGAHIGKAVKRRAGERGCLYVIVLEVKRSDEADIAQVVRTWEEWHRALGHASMEVTWVMAKEGMVKGMELKGPTPREHFCKACVQGKHKVAPFPAKSETKVEKPGDLTVSDVWGPAPVAAIGGFKYYISFTDVATRFTTLYFLQDKTEVADRYKDYEAFISNLHNCPLCTIRFDNG